MARAQFCLLHHTSLYIQLRSMQAFVAMLELTFCVKISGVDTTTT